MYNGYFFRMRSVERNFAFYYDRCAIDYFNLHEICEKFLSYSLYEEMMSLSWLVGDQLSSSSIAGPRVSCSEGNPYRRTH